MKKFLLLLTVCLFTLPMVAVNNVSPESQEVQQTSKPQWINMLEFKNRTSDTYSAKGEMYFPENATVIILLAAPSSSVNPNNYYGYYLSLGGSYNVNSTMGDQYITVNIQKGQTLKVEARRNGIYGGPARVAISQVNGYAHNPYPVVH